MPPKRSFKVCCIATTAIIFLIIITLVILYFTIFKPKQPKVVATPVNITHIDFSLIPNITLSLSIRIIVVIKNPNYAGFKYGSSTASIFYGGNLVGDAVIDAGMIAARSTENISTVVNVLGDKVIGNLNFMLDVFKGFLNMSVTSSVEGKVILLGIFKLHAKTCTNCNVSVFVWQGNSTSNCNSKIEL